MLKINLVKLATALTLTFSIQSIPTIGANLVTQAQTRASGQVSSNPLRGFALANIAISTPNQDRMITWYREVLGFRLVEKTEGAGGIKLAIMEKDGVQLDLIQPPKIQLLIKPQAPPMHLETPGIRNLVFWVDDLKAAEASLKAKKVSLLFESFYVEGIKTTISAFRDPDGNLVALWQKR
ncbi:hypothetical protein DSM106972_073220 [Dulcicalothrix desertica PCC 7102]|uniref:VOC domain-containing protein n=1 Tax=Dulcicalothrix desertica PCC 7102 TaxID=232991 RepID=A0A3S1AGX1_9CYAN|nr:VOC family protein [Dulcicalothrix desertica]RUT00551.1 hypothetical protein DSM106972_073220 [Dulcicalothrix desertica PCC 7102]TWH53305.1 catechol 2,3-dioxygenase-like lactoylglutathione lyase family enzyme [Dulcicalothrix desertica PCC 7102]